MLRCVTSPEFPRSSQEPSEPIEPDKMFTRFIKGRRRASPPSVPVTPPASPEHAVLNIHKEQVATQVRAFFDAVDARVGHRIGHAGNIREELRGRLIPTGRHQHTVDTEGLAPALRDHLQSNIFSFSVPTENGLEAMYRINFQVNNFTPSVYVKTHDGSVETTLYMGPERNQFHTVKFRRVFTADQRVREITTFTPNFMDPFKSPHPLLIAEGRLPVPLAFMIYDLIDPDGNVSLLDGQNIRLPSGGVVGRYSAAEHTIESPGLSYVKRDNYLSVGDRGDQVHFPVQTNLYDELTRITETMRSIASD